MKAITYIEIDVDSFVPGSPVGTQTFRFALPTSYLPNDIECIPSIESVSLTPVRISLGQDLGQRADLRVSFKDHLHIFGSEPYNQGTFWGKWRGRYGVKLRGRPIRLVRGVLGQTREQMEVRYYVIESTSGPTPDAVYSIEARDIMKFADDDRAQAPLLSNGKLAGSINNSTTAITLSPSGIGNLEYPSSGWVCVGGKEVVSFTRVNDALTVVRGQFGSEAQAHDSGDRVQLVLRYTGNTVAEVISDLLINYAAVSPDYINLTDWNAELTAYLGTVIYARTITEPTSVKKLLEEMVEQAALALFWDDRASQIRLVVLRQMDTSTAEFNHDNIIEGSLKTVEQPLKRISQIWTFYGQRDPTDTAAKEDNFRAALADVDLTTESLYGSPEIKKIQAAWIETAIAAGRLNAIQLSRFKNPPRGFSFDLVAGTSVTPAGGYTLRWWANQNEIGQEIPADIQITQVAFYSDRVHIEAEEMLATGDLPALVNVVFLTDVGGVFQWQVPANWNSANNNIQGIGAGAGGGADGTHGGKGGGGGAWARKNNVVLTPGAMMSYRVGAGGDGSFSLTGGDGGDTWFGAATFASANMGAKGGQGGSGQTGGGQGGQASASIGDLKNSGGNGGNGSPKGDTRAGGGGGGAAAGPNGNGGGGGGSGGAGADAGAGGGGADGGATGSIAGGGTGGNGGNNRFNFGGGNDTSPTGDEGGGGRGGNTGQNGSPGGSGEQLFTQTFAPIVSAGPGGGGGAAGDGATAGVGGLYGGGGGGNGSSGSAANDGAQGILVITWQEA